MTRILFTVAVLAALSAGSATLATAGTVANGRIAFASGRNCPYGTDIYSTLPDGTGTRRLTTGCFAEQPHWSPDGTRIAFTSFRDGDRAVYLMNADGSDVQRLTPAVSGDSPTWAPDGTQLAFRVLDPNAGPTIGVVAADGTGFTVVPGTALNLTGGLAWSPTGSRLVFDSYTDGVYDPITQHYTPGHNDIYAVGVDGSGMQELVEGRDAAWSPDGTRVVFASEIADSLWTMNPDGGDQQLLTRPQGGAAQPAWSPDGRDVAYLGSVVGGESWDYVSELFVASFDGVTQRLTTDAAWESTPEWQPLPGSIQLWDGRVSVLPANAAGPLSLGPVRISPARACGRSLLHVTTVLMDTDGRLVHGATVTASGTGLRTTSARTGQLGKATLTLRPVRALRGSRLTISVKTGTVTRKASVPVRCR